MKEDVTNFKFTPEYQRPYVCGSERHCCLEIKTVFVHFVAKQYFKCNL